MNTYFFKVITTFLFPALTFASHYDRGDSQVRVCKMGFASYRDINFSTGATIRNRVENKAFEDAKIKLFSAGVSNETCIPSYYDDSCFFVVDSHCDSAYAPLSELFDTDVSCRVTVCGIVKKSEKHSN